MEQRKGVDAILVGVNTWNLDRPRLNVRGLDVERQPVRIVLDRGGRGVYEEETEAGDVGPLWVFDGAMGIADLLQWLYVEKGLGVVMLEGGSQVLQAFFAVDCVDQVHVLRNAGMVLGAGVKSPSIGNLELRREDDLGADEHWVWERDLA
jgi:diaminohydroxyphosphoribosylaminopyrimidine deaminase/5-amino-6-(5-phosphoribosylamino)uracil reductase